MSVDRRAPKRYPWWQLILLGLVAMVEAPDVVILDLNGRLWVLDLSLRDFVKKLLDDGARHFVLNLGDITYMDSSGLGQMLAIWTSIFGMRYVASSFVCVCSACATWQ